MKRLAQKILQCLRYVWMHEEPIAQQSATIKKPMFFDSEITICRSLIGMKKILSKNNSYLFIEFCENDVFKRKRIINFLTNHGYSKAYFFSKKEKFFKKNYKNLFINI